MIYLASPYSHPDPAVRQQRFEDVAKIAAKLMEEGKIVFCPITHTAPIEKYIDDKNNTHGFWLTQDFQFLKNCDTLMVAMLDGWEKSAGVQAEIAFFKTKDWAPIVYVNADGTYDQEQLELPF